MFLKAKKSKKRTSKIIPQNERSDSPNPVKQEVKKVINNALPPNSARDLEKAMDYIERYHPNFNGSILTQPISEEISKQVELLIATSQRMETPNFFFFDKCPSAIFYFLRNYLTVLDPIIDREQVYTAFKILSEIDPLVRIEKFRDLLKTNKNKELLEHILMFLHAIESKSTKPEVTLDCLIKLFGPCIFNLPNPSKKQQKKQKTAVSFVIHRAYVLYPEEDTQGMTKEEGTGIASVQFASRKLGTDGMLHLLGQELQRISDDLEDLAYEGLSENFHNLESKLLSFEEISSKLKNDQKQFETSFSNKLNEVKLLVDQCEPTYNNVDYSITA